jgi:iron complex outermembrane recepter protein
VKLKTLAHLIALIGVAGPAIGQEPVPVPVPMPRVEITGSSIKRIAVEGALPIQTISRQEIERAGITSAEQLVATLSANGTGADNMTIRAATSSVASNRTITARPAPPCAGSVRAAPWSCSMAAGSQPTV